MILALCLFVFICLVIVCFIKLNNLLKKTNWYKNLFIYIEQFASKADDKKNKFDIVNLGSNIARYAFFYESVLGGNWSTGNQRLKEDFLILRHNYKLIKENGIILFPVSFFTSIATDLNRGGILFYARFAEFYPSHFYTGVEKSLYKKGILFKKYPLLFNPKLIRYLLRDCDKNDILSISEQGMQRRELINDANIRVAGWKRQFNITDLSEPLFDVHKKTFNETVELFNNTLNFCIENKLRPVIIVPPETTYLSSHFSEKAREQYLYSFIRQANKNNVLFLDYYEDERFQDPSLYFNSYLLNLKGRKLFTKQVLHDLDFSNQ